MKKRVWKIDQEPMITNGVGEKKELGEAFLVVLGHYVANGLFRAYE